LSLRATKTLREPEFSADCYNPVIWVPDFSIGDGPQHASIGD